MSTTLTLSSFVQTPTQVIAHLVDGDVLLTRRGGETLRLSKARTADDEAGVLAALTQLVALLLREDTGDRIADHLSDPFPWIELLPVGRRTEFVESFLRVARGCASVGRFDQLGVLLEAWKATAAAYADPATSPDGRGVHYLDQPQPVPGRPAADSAVGG